MTDDRIDLQEAFDAGFLVVKKYVDDIERDFAARLETIEGRLLALEQHGIRYLGIWQRAADYKRGDAVTHDSNLWIALRATQPNEAPGADATAWQLARRKPESRQRWRPKPEEPSDG
jgi:hypothetical protein